MRGPLEKENHEPQMTETVFLSELYGPEPEGVFSLLNKKFEPVEIKTCYGDIIIMINALMDYASILEGVIEEWGLDGYHAAFYQYHAERCRKMSRHYAEAIHYDYDKALQNCKKKRNKEGDTGEEALAAAYNKKQREVEAQAQKKDEKLGRKLDMTKPGDYTVEEIC